MEILSNSYLLEIICNNLDLKDFYSLKITNSCIYSKFPDFEGLYTQKKVVEVRETFRKLLLRVEYALYEKDKVDKSLVLFDYVCGYEGLWFLKGYEMLRNITKRKLREFIEAKDLKETQKAKDRFIECLSKIENLKAHSDWMVPA